MTTSTIQIFASAELYRANVCGGVVGVGRPLTTAQLRSGRATTKHTCSYVRSVPQRLRRPSQMRPRGIDPVYQRYTEAYGIPVVGEHEGRRGWEGREEAGG